MSEYIFRLGRLLLIWIPLWPRFSSSDLEFENQPQWWDLSLLVTNIPLVPAIEGISFRKLEAVRQSG
jgi:hypothetical protein